MRNVYLMRSCPGLKPSSDFHLAFWSLQLPFSRPSLFAEVQTFSAFKDAVTRVLPTIKEATAKERSLMGNKSHHAPAGPSAPLKRKREPAAAESTGYSEYYFAKYLTSPELLDLEVDPSCREFRHGHSLFIQIADTHFRRQFLFQLLILLNHLLNFTKAAKATWSTSRNRSLQIDFTLEAADAQWVQETITRAVEELRQTSPNGRAFAEAVQVMLEREKNWVRWKNELCPPFDREPWSEEVEVDGTIRKVGLEEATEDVRKKMRMDPEDWPHRYGSAPLTEIWEMGYRDLRDLEHPFQYVLSLHVMAATLTVYRPGDVKDFVRKIKQEDARIDLRKKQLTQKAERMAQARARAAALKDGTPAPGLQAVATTAPSNPQTQPPAAAAPSPEAQRQNASGGPALLHPSLPAKPGSTPAPGESAAPSPARVSTPNPPSAATAPAPVSAPAPAPTPAPAAAPTPEPAPIVLPPDDMIRKYEEVCASSHNSKSLLTNCSSVIRTSSVGHGSRCGRRETSTCSTSGGSALETSYCSPKRSSGSVWSARRPLQRKRRRRPTLLSHRLRRALHRPSPPEGRRAGGAPRSRRLTRLALASRTRPR